jgi:predicted ATPase
MITGAPAAASESFEQAEGLAKVLRHQSRERRMAIAHRFAADPEIATRFHVCLTHWCLGRIDQAYDVAAQAVAAARAMGHAHTLGHALAHGAIFAVICRDVDAALALGTETIEFAEKHDMELWKGYGCMLKAYALALKGDVAGSAPLMERGFAYMARTQTGAMVPLHHAMHACTLAALGRVEEAAHHAEIVREELRSGSERYFWPECQRLLGDYLRLFPGSSGSQIESSYAAALATARGQGAKSWELYAATSQARLWAERGERRRALDLLRPLREGFTEGFGRPILKDSGALIESLQS